MKAALKAHESMRLTTLRGLLAACTNELIAHKQKPDALLDDDGVLAVVKRAVKQRKDSIEQFEKGGRPELAEQEREELAVLEEYLPAQASREVIEEAAREILSTQADLSKEKSGILVGAVMKKLGGNADGSLVKEVVQELFD